MCVLLRVIPVHIQHFSDMYGGQPVYHNHPVAHPSHLPPMHNHPLPPAAAVNNSGGHHSNSTSQSSLAQHSHPPSSPPNSRRSVESEQSFRAHQVHHQVPSLLICDTSICKLSLKFQIQNRSNRRRDSPSSLRETPARMSRSSPLARARGRRRGSSLPNSFIYSSSSSTTRRRRRPWGLP